MIQLPFPLVSTGAVIEAKLRFPGHGKRGSAILPLGDPAFPWNGHPGPRAEPGVKP